MIDYNKLKGLSKDGLIKLSDEIRKDIITVSKKNGGHLASNLGAVEITVALHYVFDFPSDKLIFDVGHQCYAHKLLTQGLDAFKTIRTYGGISGFLKSSEDGFNAVDTGHSSESLSLSTGFLRARRLTGKKYNVIAVLGDGAFAGGMCYEALHDLSVLDEKLIVLLNDNEVTISKTKQGINNLIKGGENFFKSFGFDYIDNIEGHSFESLLPALEKAKNCNKSVILHIKTVKGKGLIEAEENPEKFHSYSQNSEEGYSDVAGKAMLEIGADKRVVAITAAMKKGTGLSAFADKFGDRFIDVGICEEHALALTVGLAKEGFKPYFAVYSSFLNRGVDQLINDVSLQNLPVTILLDRSGVVCDDGETHQGTVNLSYLNAIPNLTIAAPKNKAELYEMIKWSKDFNFPLVIRYPKGGESVSEAVQPVVFAKYDNMDISKSDVIILTSGANMYVYGKKLTESIIKKGIKATTINAKFIKPLDADMLISASDKKIIVLEDNVESGGLYQNILAFYNDRGMNTRVKGFSLTTSFLPCGKVNELLNDYGFNEEEVLLSSLRFINEIR